MSKFYKPRNNGKQAIIGQGSQSRAAAAKILAGVETGLSLSDLMPRFTAELDLRDRALVSEIVHGTLRHRRLLNLSLHPLLDHKLSSKYREVNTLLLSAIYQIVFMRTPPHAVVASTVGACALCKCQSFTGMVNAVLRRFLREGAHLQHSTEEAIEFSFPDWLYNKIKNAYGDKTKAILKASNEHAPMWLRVENSKIGTDDYLVLLEKCDIFAVRTPFCSSALQLEEPVITEKLPLFKRGRVSVQDLAAQLAAPLLDLKPQMRVLDTCSAPGGKSAHILDLEPTVELTALDSDEKRLASAKENLARLQRNAVFKVLDAQDLSSLEGEFDRILVDAPCSGTGVIRRHPDIKWLRREGDIANLTAIQAKILDSAFSKLKKGGILLYTTCSILPEENSEQIEAFLSRHADAQLLPFNIFGQSGGTFQHLPGDDDADGFFYARMIKNS